MPPSSDPTLPALLGGPPVRPQGPPPWPVPDDDVRAALDAAYRDGSWGRYHGGNVERLEDRLAEYHGVPHVLTCASGTISVELALRGLGVGPGHEVVLPAYDYTGNFLDVHALGARPVLVDVTSSGATLDLDRLADALGPRTRAVVVSHMHGALAPMRDVMALSAEHGVPVVEDACQTPGAVVQGRRAGAWGDVGVLSFGGSKLLTAGRGGVLLTAHADAAQRIRRFQMRANLISPLSELQAAVLLPQLDKLDAWNERRRAAVARLTDRLRGLPGLRPFASPGVEGESAYYKLGFWYDADAFGLARDLLTRAARAEGVALDVGFPTLHVGRSPTRFRAAGPLDVATRAHYEVVVLHHPVLLGSDADVEEVAAALHKLYAGRQRLRDDPRGAPGAAGAVAP